MSRSCLRSVRPALAALALVLAMAAPSMAHLMPPGNGSVRLVAGEAYLALAVDVRSLDGWDDDVDGWLGAAELSRHRAELLRQLGQRVEVTDGARAGALVFEDLLFEADEAGAQRSRQLTLLRRLHWPKPPAQLMARVALFGVPGSDELQMRVLRGSQTETTILGPGRESHVFFRGGQRPATLLLLALALLALPALRLLPRQAATMRLVSVPMRSMRETTTSPTLRQRGGCMA